MTSYTFEELPDWPDIQQVTSRQASSSHPQDTFVKEQMHAKGTDAFVIAQQAAACSAACPTHRIAFAELPLLECLFLVPATRTLLSSHSRSYVKVATSGLGCLPHCGVALLSASPITPLHSRLDPCDPMHSTAPHLTTRLHPAGAACCWVPCSASGSPPHLPPIRVLQDCRRAHRVSAGTASDYSVINAGCASQLNQGGIGLRLLTWMLVELYCTVPGQVVCTVLYCAWAFALLHI